MNLLIMGLPGCGKGTQSDLIVAKYHVGHLATGNLFREEIKKDSALGKELNSYMSQGLLVPDSLTISLLQAEISKEKYQHGFLLDGFPRNLQQAQALDVMLKTVNQKIDAVLYLDLDQDEIIKRLTGRLFCPTCQRTYHEVFNKPQNNMECDVCHTPLIKRNDDSLASVKKRLEVSQETLLPLISYYEKQQLLHRINITKDDSIAQVFSKIEAVLDHD